MELITPRTGVKSVFELATGALAIAAESAGASAESFATGSPAAADVLKAAQGDATAALSALDHVRAAVSISTFQNRGLKVEPAKLSEARQQLLDGIGLLGADAEGNARAVGNFTTARQRLVEFGASVDTNGFSTISISQQNFATELGRAVGNDTKHRLARIPAEVDEEIRNAIANPKDWLDSRPALPGANPPDPDEVLAGDQAIRDEVVKQNHGGAVPAGGAGGAAGAAGSSRVLTTVDVPISPTFTLQRLPEDSPLGKFGRDITMDAADHKVDPVFGREGEINQVAQALARRTKNNPMLLGEPGVGKTAIVEGLGIKIVTGDVAPQLQNRRLIALDIGSMTSGGGQVGKVEERWKAVFQQIDELREQGENPIIFIDELHTAMGTTQSATGSTAELLKPRLARANSGFIGATTKGEHAKLVEGNGAFDRRWQPVDVDPPDVDQTISILRLKKQDLEAFHGVRITDQALQSAAHYADRYITDRFMPDKAIDLVDSSMARVAMARQGRPPQLAEVESAIAEGRQELRAVLRSGGTSEAVDALRTKLAGLESEAADLRSRVEVERPLADQVAAQWNTLEEIGNRATAAETAGNAAEADRILDEELMPAANQLRELRGQYAAAVGDRPGIVPAEAGELEIASEIQRRTGIPMSRMSASESERLLAIEDELHQSVIGHDDAVSAMARAIRRNRSGVGDPNRPYGSFLLLGPTGVGKTQLMKSVGSVLFDEAGAEAGAASERGMVRLDMGSFQDKATASRLVGSPPGYVNSEEGGQLTEPVRRNGFRSILLDEVEKAHPDVFDTLLPIIDEGKTTDALGRTVNFRNTVIGMTTNLSRDELGSHFRPEFLNRIDEILELNHLTPDDMGGIVGIQLRTLQARLASPQNAGISLAVDDAARGALANWGYDPAYGARPVKRAIQRYLEDPLSDAVLKGQVQRGGTAHVTLAADGTSLVVTGEPPAAATSAPAGTFGASAS